MPPEPDDSRPALSPGRRYSIFVGVAFLALIVVATLSTIRAGTGGTLGASEDERGRPLAEFAVPDARSSLEGDANVAQDDCSTSQDPCPEDARRVPACRISRDEFPGAIRVCDFFDRPLVLSFWFTRGADCLPTQDLVDRMAARYRGRVNFLSIDIRDDRDKVRTIIAEHGWKIPVGYDADGAVSDLYRVGGCPTVAFAYPGGILAFAKVGTAELSAPLMRADIHRLLSETRRRQHASAG
jgi:hypothetical protein